MPRSLFKKKKKDFFFFKKETHTIAQRFQFKCICASVGRCVALADFEVFKEWDPGGKGKTGQGYKIVLVTSKIIKTKLYDFANVQWTLERPASLHKKAPFFKVSYKLAGLPCLKKNHKKLSRTSKLIEKKK